MHGTPELAIPIAIVVVGGCVAGESDPMETNAFEADVAIPMEVTALDADLAGSNVRAAAVQFIEAAPGRSYFVSADTRWRPSGANDRQRMEVWFYGWDGNSYRVLRKYGTATRTMRVTAPPRTEHLVVILDDVAIDLYGDVVRVVAE